MSVIAYSSPFIPAEWIAAHGLKPCRMVPEHGDGRDPASEGQCGFAAAVLDSVPSDAVALVLATTCDQMRRAADFAHRIPCPVFLFTMPATWQTAGARRLYQTELERLGRFLESRGGRIPAATHLAETLDTYDHRRAEILRLRPRHSARRHAELLTAFYQQGVNAALSHPSDDRPAADHGIPLMLVGGPLCRADWSVLDALEAAGGRVVLDATETGERTWPAPFEPRKRDEKPVDALVDAYFGSIPDVFRRPNGPLYEWIAERINRLGVRGLVLVRQRWCDLWIAETFRLRESIRVPLLALDLDGESSAHHRGRIEAFLEMLR